MTARQPMPMPTSTSSASAVEAFTLGEEPSNVTRFLSAGEAQRLTQLIKLTASGVRNGLFKLRNQIDEAKRSNAWQVLGFASWTAYLADALGEEPMRVSREERIELVTYLAGEGLSTRAIAPIVGVSQRTVANDVSNSAHLPEPPVETATTSTTVALGDVAAGVEASPEPPRAVTGLDGKTYQRPAPAPAETAAVRERAEAERAAQQEWIAFRDLYSGIVSASMTLAGYSTNDPARLFRNLEHGMLMPNQEREFTPERMRAAIQTLTNLIAWKEQSILDALDARHVTFTRDLFAEVTA